MSSRPEPSTGNPSVTLVIPTHSNAKLLRECLDAVRALSYPREQLETIVVDNASEDGTADLLKKHYPKITHIRLDRNTGFAPACNLGAARGSCEYVAFLNDDAVPEPNWLEALLAALAAGGEGAVCAASHIRSRDGQEVEFNGASANLFGVGRPYPASNPSSEGDPLLFASGGAMLIHRRTFLDAGGFDPEFFAYFEDVDLGWRLWVMGHRVVYAPGAVVRHVGGATGSLSAPHRRYTLWECNALATVLKNYESGNMERILSAALLLQYKRTVLSAGSAFRAEDYNLTAPKDTNTANVERLPKVSVAHLAAINRFNRLIPHFMRERRRIQSARKRPDAEILPLLGNPWQPQFAGDEYAQASRDLAHALSLYDIASDDKLG
jgi:GT2 family glycosyltransferase